MIRISYKWITNNCTFSLADTPICDLIKTLDPDIFKRVQNFIRDIEDESSTESELEYYNFLVKVRGQDNAKKSIKGYKTLYWSLKNEGQKKPLLIWKENTKWPLSDGAHRLIILDFLGHKTVKTLDINLELRNVLKDAFPTGAGTEKKIYQPLEVPGFEDFEVIRPDNYERADSIIKELDEEDKTFVDIGSNLSFMSRYIIKKLGWKHFTNVDISEVCALASYLLFMMQTCQNIIYGHEELRNCYIGDYKDLKDIFDVSICLSVFHHYFKSESREQLKERFRHLGSITRRKTFVEIDPRDKIVESDNEDVKAIFKEGLESFILESSGAKQVKILGDFWGGRRLYLLKYNE